VASGRPSIATTRSGVGSNTTVYGSSWEGARRRWRRRAARASTRASTPSGRSSESDELPWGSSPGEAALRPGPILAVAVVVLGLAAAGGWFVSRQMLSSLGASDTVAVQAQRPARGVGGWVKSVDKETRTFSVASWFIGLWPRTRVAVTRDTRILVGDKEGGFGDLQEGRWVRVCYDEGSSVAQPVEIRVGLDAADCPIPMLSRPADSGVRSADSGAAPPVPAAEDGGGDSRPVREQVSIHRALERAEPPRGESTRSEPARPESARSEPARAEPPRAEPAEPARSEPAKAEPPKVEPATPAPARPEPARPDPTRPEPTRPATARTEPARPASPKSEPARPEPRREETRADAKARPELPPQPRAVERLRQLPVAGGSTSRGESAAPIELPR
jgi:hypothetical protein